MSLSYSRNILDLRVVFPGENETLVRIKKNLLQCECSTWQRLSVWEHVLKVVGVRGDQCFKSFVQTFRSVGLTKGKAKL